MRYLYRKERNGNSNKTHCQVLFFIYFKGENMDKERLIEDIIEILEEDEKYIERPIVINIYLGSDE